MYRLLLLLVCAFSLVGIAKGQDSAGIAFRGTIGVYGELYSMKGIMTRRPHATGRLNLRGDLHLNGFRVPVEIFYSSEDDAIRQTINRLSLGYKNSWLDVRAGDAYPLYSPLVINGIFVRGGHVSIAHKGLIVRANAGQNQRAIEENLRQGAIGMYRRYLYAGSIGYDDERFSASMHALRGVDEISSLSKPASFATPQENIIIGMQAGASAFSRTLKLKAEVNRSVWTKDIREPPQANGSLPGIFQSLLVERPSSYSDMALRSEISYQDNGVSVSGLFQRIGGDYFSMGVFGFQPDWQEFRVQAIAPLLNYMLNISAYASTKKDNLSGKKYATTTRNNGGISVGYRINQTYAINTNYAIYLDNNNAATSTSRIDQVSHNLTIQPMRDWGDFSNRQHVNLLFGYQTMKDRIQRQFVAMGFTRYSIGGTYNRTFYPGFSMYSNLQYSSNQTTVATLVSRAATLGASFAVIPNQFTTNGQLSYTVESSVNGMVGNARFQARISGIYSINETMQAQCDVDGTLYRATVLGGVRYTELKSSLTINKRY